MTDEQYLATKRALLRHAYELSRLDLAGFVLRAGALEAGPVRVVLMTVAAAALRLQETFREGQGEIVGALADAFVHREGPPAGEGGGGFDPCAGGGVL